MNETIKSRQLLVEYLAAEREAGGQADRFFSLLLLWAQPGSATANSAELHSAYGGRTPIGLHRSGWSSEDTMPDLRPLESW